MSGAVGDRNLLVGVLALQMDFIGREQLVAAMNAWVLEKQTSLEEILERQGALDRQSRELLKALAAKHLALHGNNAEQSLKAVPSLGSVKDDLRSLADGDIERSLVHVHESSDQPSTISFAVGSSTSSGQRFRVLRPHGRGGLGEVHVALDTELHREVALKEIGASHAHSPESRARFTLEAEITGSLEHPGIVPVYGLGSYADGRPYYAMRFIRGHDLNDAIAKFHSPERKFAPGERSLELRKLLGRLVDVCEAIEYAHSRGVLHRDLKPGNIMLGKYGETLVVDWGLAKAVGKHDPLSDEPTLRPQLSSGSGSAATQMGSALGTPSYMSPEQAAGRLDELGPPSDVYSLGATLYCLLAGDAPYPKTEKVELGELLRKVQTGDFPRPRSRKADIPKPLEAVCLKAMALRPVDRYATPAKLAEDIEHWLADEPVSAAADTLTERAARLVRKHKSGTLAAALALIAVAAISTGAAVLINRQRVEKSELAQEMQIEAAKSAFSNGVSEYEAGHVGAADQEFVRALALLPSEHALRASYELVAWDRVTRGGRALIPPLRHRDWVALARFSPDGKRVVTASGDKAARIWDATTGIPLSAPLRHSAGVVTAQFSPDGTRVVTASHDKTARLWDAHTGAMLGEPMIHDDSYVMSAQFSPDGNRVVTACSDKTVRIWDAATGVPLGEPLRHDDFVHSAEFSLDGTRILIASNMTARVWDAATGIPVGEPLRHEDAILVATFLPDGQHILTASVDRTAVIWDVATGAPRGKPMEHGGDDARLTADISPDGKYVVTSFDFTQVWDAATGDPVGPRLPETYCARFSPDGKHVVAACADLTTRFWDAATGAPIGEPFQHESQPVTFEFSPDGKSIAVALSDNIAQIFNTPSEAAPLDPLRHEDEVRSAEFSADGKLVVTASSDKTSRIWDAVTGFAHGEPLRSQGPVYDAQFSPDGEHVLTTGEFAQIWVVASGTALGNPLPHEEIQSCEFSADGKFVATAGSDKIMIWNAATGAPLGEPFPDKDVISVHFSPDGQRILSASWAENDHVAQIWDIATRKRVGKPLRHKDFLYSAEFSPDGLLVVTTSRDETAQIWEATTGDPIGQPLRHPSLVFTAQFSLDGTRLVTADDSFARIWDVKTGDLLGKPMRHGSAIMTARFSPDGKRVVTASWDETARVWDAATGAPLGAPFKHMDEVLDAQFSPDGTRVVTASRDKTARIWDVSMRIPSVEWSASAISLWTGLSADERGRVRELTDDEWTNLAARFQNSNDPWAMGFRAWRQERLLRN